MADAHYVKFQRGSIRAWQNLQSTPSLINDDTLYFIYESSADTTEGKLYLGKKLISGTGSGSSGVININDLQDIYIDNTSLADAQILAFNETAQEWQNVNLSDIINTAISTMTGATSSTDGEAGYVPKPLAGDEDKFLKGNGTWATVNIPTFDPNVLIPNTANKITIAGFENAPIGSLPQKTSAGIEWVQPSSGNLHRQVISRADLEDPETSLSEDIIYMVPIDGADESSGNKYDEYLIINGKPEYVGGFGTDLSNYVTNTVFNQRVGSLENVLNDQTNPTTGEVTYGLISKMNKVGNLNDLLLSTGNNTLVEEVNTINANVTELSERLRWHELTE